MKTRRLHPLGGSALAFALLAMAIASTASAQQAAASSSGSESGESFQSLDTNHDGHLSRSEIPSDMPLLRTRLSTYDANQDGSLDAHEFAAAQAALHGKGNAGGGGTSSPPRHTGG